MNFLRGRRQLMCLCILLASSAQAQTPNPTPEWHYSEGHLLDAHVRDKPSPEWDRVLGVAVDVQPKYDGGDAYSISAGPTFDVRYYDVAFASAGEGFGVNLLHSDITRAGVALVYDLGRTASADHFLHGTGNISVAPGIKVFAEYLLFPVTFRIDLRHYFGGVGGYIGDISAYMPLGGKDHVYFIFAGPAMSFANADNLRHSFGISPGQSEDSGYAEHGLGGGVRSYSFGLSGGYFFTRHLIFEGFVAGQQLISGAGGSPLVKQRGEMTLQSTVVYRW